jgi:hypothetical protein
MSADQDIDEGLVIELKPVVIPLCKPVTAHGEEIDSITLRPPEPEDVMQIGLPTLLIPSADGESVGVEVRTKVVGLYIMKLGAIPLSSVKALHRRDFDKCLKAVMGFFN